MEILRTQAAHKAMPIRPPKIQKANAAKGNTRAVRDGRDVECLQSFAANGAFSLSAIHDGHLSPEVGRISEPSLSSLLSFRPAPLSPASIRYLIPARRASFIAFIPLRLPSPNSNRDPAQFSLAAAALD